MSNPFLTKKDPLVEAVQSAMQDGEIRRQAEALVNEEFGVYSRKAVIRENLAAYDARLEEAYKCMKEGKPLADKDYDKDGKIESPKDEVWGSRFRAAKMAGKMEEKKSCYEEEQIDELKKPTAKTAMQAYRRAETHDDMDGNWNRSNRLYRWKEKNLPGKSARNQKPTGKAKLPDVSNTDFHKDGYSGHFTKKGKLTKSATKDTKADIKSRLGKHTKPNLPEEAMNEAAYSAKAARAGKDIGKPGKMFSKIAAKAGEKYGSEERGKKVAGAILKRIRAKHMKEEHLEEVSAFGKEYSAQRAKLGQGGVYHSKVTGRDIKIQDKSPSKPTSSVSPDKPTSSVSPDKPTTWADPSKRDYSSSNQGVVKPSTSTPPASMATGGTTSMKMPDSLAGRDQAKDVSSAETAVRGIRSYNRGTDTVSPSKYNTPGSAGSATGRSTDLPMDPGAAENAKRKTGSLNEAVQVGEYKYRII
jgi:hypothetical protein